jgi:hypothetical protein
LTVISRLRDEVQFTIERMLVRGTAWRFGFIIAVVGLVSIVGGLLVVSDAAFEDAPGAMWWAFLHLTDPGYLGDNEGVFVRVVATVLTVGSYVLFFGGVIIIITDWQDHALRGLEAGLTPIAGRDHIAVLGWTTRTAQVVQELVMSDDRVELFLSRKHRSALRVVVMADHVDAAFAQNLRERVGPAYSSRKVILRSGTALRLEHLRRVGALQAGAIILPAPDIGLDRGVDPDTHTIKTLLSLSSFVDEHGRADAPLAVAEVVDGRKILTARRAYVGPLEVVATRQLVSRLIAQNIRHPGLAEVYTQLLSHGEGSEIYSRECPELAGMRIGQLSNAFPRAILVGVVRTESTGPVPLLNPADDFVLRKDDRLVLVADDYAQTAPITGYPPQRTKKSRERPPPPELEAQRRVLVLGWNHRVPELLAELESCRSEQFEIVIASTQPLAERERQMTAREISIERCRVIHHELDYTVPGHLRRLEPGGFDNIVMLGNDEIGAAAAQPRGSDEADANTILGHVLLRELVPEGEGSPDVLVELVDPANLALFRSGESEVLVAPRIVSHVLAQVGLRRELASVFDALLASEGVELLFRDAAHYGLVGKLARFEDLQRAAIARNETALGLRRRWADGATHGSLLLNPPRDTTWTLGEHDQLVVLATYA